MKIQKWLSCLWLVAFIPALLLGQDTFQSTEERSIFVNGACAMCKDRIEEAALTIQGVESADWSEETHMLKVAVTPSLFDEDQLHYAVTGVGHDTKSFLANNAVYNELPACCLYRELYPAEHPTTNETDNFSIVKGIVFEEGRKGKKLPLVGTNIFWADSGTGAVANTEGEFELPNDSESNMLIFSYIGYAQDTVFMGTEEYVEITLKENVQLEEVEVTHRSKTTEVSFLEPIKVQRIGEGELQKAACCNLSESFETNPSVDVHFTDAVTGTRQIQMLGLAGPYTQIMREVIPDVRGLSSLFGLTYTPGHWVESIQLNKGVGAVSEGFESIAGQINVELRKPEESDPVYLNFYANEGRRIEGNVNLAHKLNEKWSTALLLHAKNNAVKQDRNSDGFLDNPLNTSFIALNRWRYIAGSDGLRSQFGIKGTYIDNQGGQMEFEPTDDQNSPRYWGMDMETKRLEAWGKIGWIFRNLPNTSIGLQLSALNHQQDSYFGARTYNAEQTSFYANLMFQTIIGTTDHKVRAGLSFAADEYEEDLNENNFLRDEVVPGVYGEYTYTPSQAVTIVAGIRGDHHNNFGFFATPRIHLRYAPYEKTVFRLAAGRGQRTANVLAENNSYLASSREFVIRSVNNDNPYGLDPEVAWNYGANATQGFEIGGKEATISVDYYYTHFENQIVIDLDANPQQLIFYNLEGESFAHSLQAQFDYELIEKLDVRVAYRLFDVKTTYGDELLRKPLQAQHRAFINLAYETPNQWKFDYTLNWEGQKRIPNTASNPEAFRLDNTSPDFFLMNAQVTKVWNNKLDVYFGVENLLNFRQDNPILAADQPFSPYFDASMIWGPVFGRMSYLGLRFKIEK